LSFIVAPSIGGWLALYSLRAPFVVDGLLSFAACAAIFVFVRDRRGAVTSPCLPAEGRETLPLQIARVFSQRRTWAFAFFSAVNNFAFPILAAFLPIKAVSLGYIEWQIAVMLALEAIGFTIASFVVGRFSDRIGRRPFVLVAQPLIVLACIGLFFARDLPALIAWYTLFGLASGTTFLLGLVMMADITPSERTATTLGSFDAMIDLVIFIAPLVAIVASGVIGTEWVLALAGLPALIAFPIALATRETRTIANRE
jgi:MFS family permease